MDDVEGTMNPESALWYWERKVIVLKNQLFTAQHRLDIARRRAAEYRRSKEEPLRSNLD